MPRNKGDEQMVVLQSPALSLHGSRLKFLHLLPPIMVAFFVCSSNLNLVPYSNRLRVLKTLLFDMVRKSPVFRRQKPRSKLEQLLNVFDRAPCLFPLILSLPCHYPLPETFNDAAEGKGAERPFLSIDRPRGYAGQLAGSM